ncbi:MAG: zinc metalloprotease HtpX [Planctomycetota bacterium]|nr:zinc metalloprotease HtpX [Planctomycetota bacterium]
MLYIKSIIVLAFLFGIVFAVGMGAMTAMELEESALFLFSAIFACFVVFLQYLFGPWIIGWLYRIRWTDVSEFKPEVRSFVERTCEKYGMTMPRMGIIDDGNPTAFTYGHYPGNARLVVSSGLLAMLDPPQQMAVIAHELGHIKHWDFVVMTIAAIVPLILYIIARTLFRVAGSVSRGRGKNKGGAAGAVLTVAVVSYIAYIVSHYIVLLLSRVREYYADEFSAKETRDPNALSGALVSIAYGLAKAPEAGKDDAGARTRSHAAATFGIFDPKIAKAMAFASMSGKNFSAENMEGAMKWDLWNPWAFWYELHSTHPLPAKRIKALSNLCRECDVPPKFLFEAKQPESYWDEFLVDVFFALLPTLALVGGIVGGIFSDMAPERIAGLTALLFGAGTLVRVIYKYKIGSGFAQKTVPQLLSEVKVSAIRSVPAQIKGTIIGRGIPGLFYSEDLVMQDDEGFITLDYRQPLGFLDFIFGWLKADSLIGKQGVAEGWYRRHPMPYLELKRLTLNDGTVVNCWYFHFKVIMALLVAAAGVVLFLMT